VFFRAEPVERREELFDREREAEELERGIKRVPITLVLGVRRVGKTSLVKAVTSGMKSVYIDLRKFEWRRPVRLKDFLDELRVTLPWKWRLSDLLSAVKNTFENLSVFGSGVKFRKGYKRSSLYRLFETLNRWGESEGEPIVVVLDEAQELARLDYGDILPLLAWAFDNLRFVRFVLTGSKAGLLYRFLRLDDAESPLYGRSVWKVELGPLPRELAKEFLRTGFAKEGLAVGDDVVERAVEELDGIIGWLVHFGLRVVQSRDAEKALEEAVREGTRLVWNEFCRFLRFEAINDELALEILRFLVDHPTTEDEVANAIGESRWAELGAKEVLKRLVDWGYLRGEGGKYLVADPLLAKAVKKYPRCLPTSLERSYTV